MAALSANRDRYTADTHNLKKSKLTGVDSDEFYAGGLVSNNGSGKAVPASDGSGHVVLGICSKRITTGASNTLEVPYEFNHTELLANNGNITAAHIGAQAYVVDDQTVGLAADVTNNVPAGRIEEVTSAGVYVWIGGASL
jgi:hypothetical protein